MLNAYEQKQQDKKDGLLAAANRRRAKSDELSTAGWEALQAIPFGQPILVGHHSEKGDRAYRGRAVRKIDKSVELSKEAEELETRAAAVGTGGISSDDPEAVTKLEEQLAGLKKAHAQMLEVNVAYKAFKKDPATLDASTLPEPLKQIVRTWVPRYSWERAPFVKFQLSNSGANIRRIEKRIAELRAVAAAPAWGPFVGPGWLCEEHKDDNRIVFKFREIPSPEIRALLRSRAFLWSPSRGLWVRKVTGNAKFAAEQIIAKLPQTQ